MPCFALELAFLAARCVTVWEALVSARCGEGRAPAPPPGLRTYGLGFMARKHKSPPTGNFFPSHCANYIMYIWQKEKKSLEGRHQEKLGSISAVPKRVLGSLNL